MNPLQLVELLRGHKNYIQTHNYPDPDAVASAFGLQYFLKQHGVEATICYEGTVEKLSTRKMFEVFQIDVLEASQIQDMTEQDYIVAVDSQKYNANLTDLVGDEVACIDHHPTFIECSYQYGDIRKAGACSTLIAQYFYQTRTPMDATVAAALAYGIKVDTADFIRGVTELDLDMFAYVYKQADVDKIKIMYHDVLELDEEQAKVVDHVHTGAILVDGLGVGDVGNIVLRDRQHLAEDGILIVVMTLERYSNQLLAGPDIVSRGFVYVRESEVLMDEARHVVESALDGCMDKHITDWGKLKNATKDALSEFLWKKTKRSPMILPIIMEV